MSAKIGDRRAVTLGLCLAASIAQRLGVNAQAVRLLGAAGEFPDHFGGAMDPYLQVEAESARSRAREALGEEAFARAWAEGQAMTLEQAVEYALREDEA